MNADAWREIDGIFSGAVEVPSGRARGWYLDRACMNDVMLRLEVERLLDADREAAAFLEEPVCRIEVPEAWPMTCDRLGE